MGVFKTDEFGFGEVVVVVGSEAVSDRIKVYGSVSGGFTDLSSVDSAEVGDISSLP